MMDSKDRAFGSVDIDARAFNSADVKLPERLEAAPVKRSFTSNVAKALKGTGMSRADRRKAAHGLKKRGIK